MSKKSTPPKYTGRPSKNTNHGRPSPSTGSKQTEKQRPMKDLEANAATQETTLVKQKAYERQNERILETIGKDLTELLTFMKGESGIKDKAGATKEVKQDLSSDIKTIKCEIQKRHKMLEQITKEVQELGKLSGETIKPDEKAKETRADNPRKLEDKDLDVLASLKDIIKGIEKRNQRLNKVSLKIKDLLTLTEDLTRSESKSIEPKTGTKRTGEKEDEDIASLENIRQYIISQNKKMNLVTDEINAIQKLTTGNPAYDLKTKNTRRKKKGDNKEDNDDELACLKGVRHYIETQLQNATDFHEMIENWLHGIENVLKYEDPHKVPEHQFGKTNETTKLLSTLERNLRALKDKDNRQTKQIQEDLGALKLIQDICQQKLENSTSCKDKSGDGPNKEGKTTKDTETTVKLVTDLSDRIAKLTKDLEKEKEETVRLKQNEEKAKQDISELQNSIAKLTKDLEEEKEETVSLKQNEEKANQDISELQYRLSRYTRADLTVDNPKIADLSDPKRPTKLAEVYSELYDNEWTNAFEELQKSELCKGWGDSKIVMSLFDILKFSYECCTDTAEKQMNQLVRYTSTPAVVLDEKYERETKDKQLDANTRQALNDLRKKTYAIASQNLCKHSEEIMRGEKKWNELFRSEHCKKYIGACIVLCWLMVIQSPPVYIDFDVSDKVKFDKDKFREYTKTGKKVDFIVWPPLYLTKHDSLLCKGVAEGK